MRWKLSLLFLFWVDIKPFSQCLFHPRAAVAAQSLIKQNQHCLSHQNRFFNYLKLFIADPIMLSTFFFQYLTSIKLLACKFLFLPVFAIKFKCLLQIVGILGLMVGVLSALPFLIRNFSTHDFFFTLLQKLLRGNLIILRKLSLCSCWSWQCLTNPVPLGLCQLCCYRTCWAWIHPGFFDFFDMSPGIVTCNDGWNSFL